MKQPKNEAILRADDLLADIGNLKDAIKDLEAQGNAAMQAVTDQIEKMLMPLREDLGLQEKALLTLMKKERKALFDGTDVLQLDNGTLIHNVEDKVSIPRDALAECKTQGFTDVIKIAESLDREAIEKWPDAKLFLIGAKRKPVEEFSYDLKKEGA